MVSYYNSHKAVGASGLKWVDPLWSTLKVNFAVAWSNCNCAWLTVLNSHFPLKVCTIGEFVIQQDLTNLTSIPLSFSLSLSLSLSLSVSACVALNYMKVYLNRPLNVSPCESWQLLPTHTLHGIRRLSFAFQYNILQLAHCNYPRLYLHREAPCLIHLLLSLSLSLFLSLFLSLHCGSCYNLNCTMFLCSAQWGSTYWGHQ